jgi:hypothetical protein
VRSKKRKRFHSGKRPHGHVAHWNMFLRSSHRNRRLRM